MGVDLVGEIIEEFKISDENVFLYDLKYTSIQRKLVVTVKTSKNVFYRYRIFKLLFCEAEDIATVKDKYPEYFI